MELDIKMRVEYAVMAHESRFEHMIEVATHLNTGFLSVDDGTLGVWGNARKCWLTIDPGSDYGIVIQDDAILCNDFRNKAETFLEQHKGHVISFYFGHQRKSVKYLRPEYFDAPLYHAVALAIPSDQIIDMIRYCDKKTEVEGDDMKIRRWLISQNRTCRYSNPSLVQHKDISSIVNPDKPVRQSNIFCG